ncbi:hypothetical protein ELBI_55 [Anabaena phage Elbi]|nr:hypothetical protein ELBI_55 [Anabaena phage Elbi]
MYYYHVTFYSFDSGEHAGRDKVAIPYKITAENYDRQLTAIESLLQDKWGFEVVVTHFQLLDRS